MRKGYGFEIHENAGSERDLSLLSSDKLTFSVLATILNYPCKKIITDHERIIMCYSAPPFPVWLWVAEDITQKELDRIWSYICEEFPASEGFQFNTKYSLASYMKERSKAEGCYQWEVSTNMLAYDCHEPVEPTKKVDGNLTLATFEDMETASKYIKEASYETEGHKLSEEECLTSAKWRIESRTLYFWRNGQGRIVSMCSSLVDEEYGKIQLVYTAPEDRGKGYAAWLIYEVSRGIINAGKLPMLYTNADYTPSNRCYQRVGYISKGNLCTVSAVMKDKL